MVKLNTNKNYGFVKIIKHVWIVFLSHVVSSRLKLISLRAVANDKKITSEQAAGWRHTSDATTICVTCKLCGGRC